MKCPSCGSKNPLGSKYCSSCRHPFKLIWLQYILLFVKYAFSLCLFFFLCIISLYFFPVDESGVSEAPSWYPFFILLFPIVCVCAMMIYDRKKRNPHPTSAAPSDFPPVAPEKTPARKHLLFERIPEDSPIIKYNLPRTEEERISAAKSLMADYKRYINLSHEADSVRYYFSWVSKARTALRDLEKYTGTVPEEYTKDTSLYLHFLDSEFQWKLRDAIEREKLRTISDLKTEYRNNKRSRCDMFLHSITSHQNEYDMETLEFCSHAVAEVSRAAKIPLEFGGYSESDTAYRAPIVGTPGLVAVDRMSGTEFEQWCAQLLTDIGYTNVRLTQASGDQGVDILAKYGDAQYAIQCKCYSKNLDNTPVQEVAAGMRYYHCDIGAVMTNQYFTTGARTLADSIGIRLWDRQWLQDALSIRASKKS